MTIWMGTIPREGLSKKKIIKFFEEYDVHKWIIGRETGRKGYEHYQIRFQGSDEIYDALKDWFKKGHFECANDKWSWDYESKSGNYLRSDDGPRMLRRRFGTLTPDQQLVIELARQANDRQIVCWCTSYGGAGKSFLCAALWERCLAHYVQASNTAKGLVQDVASEFIRHGRRPFIVIDIPRTWKWTDDMYYAIESIKSGLIKDTRYSSDTIDIVDSAVIVVCNSYPKVGKLSEDRWVIYSDEHP